MPLGCWMLLWIWQTNVEKAWHNALLYALWKVYKDVFQPCLPFQKYDSKSVGGNTVWVQVPPPAPRRNGLCSIQKAQPVGWAFLIPLRHSSFSPQNFAAQTFAGAPPYGPRRKAGIHFITPTQPLKPLGKAIPGRFCFCNNTLYNHFCPDAGQGWMIGTQGSTQVTS